MHGGGQRFDPAAVHHDLQVNRPCDTSPRPPAAIILQPKCVHLDAMKWDAMGVFAPALAVHDGARSGCKGLQGGGETRAYRRRRSLGGAPSHCVSYSLRCWHPTMAGASVASVTDMRGVGVEGPAHRFSSALAPGGSSNRGPRHGPFVSGSWGRWRPRIQELGTSVLKVRVCICQVLPPVAVSSLVCGGRRPAEMTRMDDLLPILGG